MTTVYAEKKTKNGQQKSRSKLINVNYNIQLNASLQAWPNIYTDLAYLRQNLYHRSSTEEC